MAQHIAHSEEARFIVLDDTAVGRYVYLAVTEGIERIHGLIRRGAGSQVHKYLHIGRGNVFYLSCFDFSLFHSLGDGVDQASCGLAERYLGDNEGLVVEFIDFGTHLEHTTTLTIIVFTYIDGSACREVGIDGERLTLEVVYGSITKFVEVMRQHLTAQSYGNTLCTLC